jgi:hypothetical protein
MGVGGVAAGVALCILPRAATRLVCAMLQRGSVTVCSLAAALLGAPMGLGGGGAAPLVALAGGMLRWGCPAVALGRHLTWSAVVV